jgi:V/A-type H+-transporting ATPase subunit K
MSQAGAIKWKMWRKMMNDAQRGLKGRILLSLVVVFFVLIVIGAFAGVKIFAQEKQQTSATQVQTQPPAKSSGAASFGLVGAAIAFGFGALGAGIGIGNVGAAAMGAIAEKPEMAGQALIFVALAEGLVIFGFITALMILGKV